MSTNRPPPRVTHLTEEVDARPDGDIRKLHITLTSVPAVTTTGVPAEALHPDVRAALLLWLYTDHDPDTRWDAPSPPDTTPTDDADAPG